MLILIIGANGKLANEFKKIFNNLDISYHLVDKENLDITNKTQVEFFFKDKKYDIIINCAAYNDVDKAEINIEECNNLNAGVPDRISKIAKKMDAVFVTFSTDFIFDGAQKTPYTENIIPKPLSIYGKSKYLGENYVCSNYDKRFIIRTSWLFGTINDDFVKQVINWSKSRKELNIVDDQISVPTYSKDLAEFSWKLISTGKFGLYHITNNGECSKYEQAEYVLDRIGWVGKLGRAKTKDFNLPAKRAEYSKLSSEKVEGILREKIPHWKDAIDRFLEEMKEEGEIE